MTNPYTPTPLSPEMAAHFEYQAARLAVPDLWAQLTSDGRTPAQAYAELTLTVAPLVDIDDYERFANDVRSAADIM